jgi:hypothetical protein
VLPGVRLFIGFVCLTLSAMPTALIAQSDKSAGKTRPRAEVLQKLIDCRAIPEDAKRLACYETQAARIDAAEANRDVVVIDREQAETARKQNFGLPAKPLLPGKPQVGGGDVEDVVSTIRSAKQLVTKRWLITLDNGARWYQAELKTIRDPKPGQQVRIRKASLGGYLANIDGQPATRVRRIEQP